MLRFKSSVIITHIAGWLLFMAFPLLFLNNHGQSSNNFALLALPQYWLFCGTFIALFYINAYWLLPYFFLRKRYFDYGIAFVILLNGVYFLQPFDRLLRRSEQEYNKLQAGQNTMDNGGPRGGFGPPPGGMPPQRPDSLMRKQPDGMPMRPDSLMGPPPDGAMPPPQQGNMPGQFRDPGKKPPRRHIDSNSLFIFLMIMALSTAMRIIQQWLLTEQRAARAEADKASAELSFLKAQINPHFLFNTLNNIYSLAIMNSEHTAQSIMKLSNIMRYVTDDVTADFVPLQHEIDCIADYIELQKLRVGRNTMVNFKVNGNTSAKKITPLMMMTFVENVFKYGVSKNIASAIDIRVDVSDASINFYCRNQIFGEAIKEQRKGVGIKNTRQRLEHLYPGKHLLTITDHDDFYTVNLIVQN
ncbi:histidine kinase [Mucilaginibacter sp. JRF]|uniref:sensor histidine kinase n=1 Tax=Mucilaginibacter sp. JRF TaxID=2780088 RepID=UPI00187E8CE0|nr:sensor histidine kinase [Mucilaginibacter sp. JRF]MBE9586112.1 histidine kinase [Mucilaginibacter sp. JRF]